MASLNSPLIWGGIPASSQLSLQLAAASASLRQGTGRMAQHPHAHVEAHMRLMPMPLAPTALSSCFQPTVLTTIPCYRPPPNQLARLPASGGSGGAASPCASSHLSPRLVRVVRLLGFRAKTSRVS